jgi:hypothetical protein
MHALTPRRARAQYDRAKNLRPKRNIKTAMNHEIMLYGIAQKEQMGALRAHRLPSVPTCAHTWLTPIPHATQASTRRSKSASIVRLRPRPTSAAPAIPCTLTPLLTVPTCVRRHVALRRVAEHAHPAAVRS